jgi:4-hydroxyphenylacetate 3-hydroxylase N terminal
VFSSGRYAEIRATGGVIANEVFVTRIQPLREGEEAHAMAFAVPINAKGLKILSQKSYEEGATSVFDNPLATRFDETLGPRLCQPQHRHVPEAIPCDTGARLPELSVPNPPDGEDAFSGRHRKAHRRDQRRRQFPAGEGAARLAGGAKHDCGRACPSAYFVPDSHTLYSAQVLPQQSMPMSSSPFANSLEAA